MAERGVTRVEETEHLIAPIVLAFSGDPFVRWMLPGSDQFFTAFQQLTRLHGLKCGPNGGAWATEDGNAAAFWYPPGVHPDGEAVGGAFAAAGVIERVAPVWQEAGAHEPDEPHWYLRQIGVDPRLQGQGQGGALMEAGLAEIDSRGDLAYLEATSEPGRVFYERHGFETLAEIQVGDSAPLWPMRRDPA